MNNQKETDLKIEQIKKTTGIKIGSYKTINKGGESTIIEVDEKWIFRFPRNTIFKEKIEKRLEFLKYFPKVSPLNVPVPKYIGDGFIGYRKIPGTHISPTTIERLSEKDRFKIAKQLGLFLRTLHNFRSDKIKFDTGYLVMRKDDYKSPPKQIAKYLIPQEQKIFQSRFDQIANNPLNFIKPTAIIHGDFYYNNILWNPEKVQLTGVIDWNDSGLGIPAMDFIMLADFSKAKNDRFLREILSVYGVKDDNLFNQIKENYIIDVMNWFWTYEKEGKPKSKARMIKKLKRILLMNR